MTFDRVKPGNSWWYWFQDGTTEEIQKVIRDGSGGLWVDYKGHGMAMDEFLSHRRCLGPVPPRFVKAKEKRTKIHLNKGGLPLCECDGRMRDFSKVHFDLTMRFKEVTCRKCLETVSKSSRVLGFEVQRD